MLLGNDCLIRVYQLFVVISQIFPIMLALCLMLSVTYYAKNYAGIICWSLHDICKLCRCTCMADTFSAFVLLYIL